jgi:hypothetical protein
MVLELVPISCSTIQFSEQSAGSSSQLVPEGSPSTSVLLPAIAFGWERVKYFSMELLPLFWALRFSRAVCAPWCLNLLRS